MNTKYARPVISGRFFKLLAAAAFVLVCAALVLAATPTANVNSSHNRKLNILLLVADDLSCASVGAFGCKVPDITPNIDRLARQGLRFEHAHVNFSICSPSRACLMTGLYSRRNGNVADNGVNPGVMTLSRRLHDAGYLNGIIWKASHYVPSEVFAWDVIRSGAEMLSGRHPKIYYEQTRSFIQKAKAENRPFLLVANTADPHRPLAGQDKFGEAGQPSPLRRRYQPEELPVPDFLPDLPEIRQDIADYYSSVHRCDESVGQVLRALDDAGLTGQTLVVFLSDNGMPFPLAKHESYYNSTHTPLIVRWPGVVKPGSVDRQHLVSAVDLMPTLLAASGLKPEPGIDGHSIEPLLRGGKQSGFDATFAEFHFHAVTNKKEDGQPGVRFEPYPVRSVQTKQFRYIVSFWAMAGKSLEQAVPRTPTSEAMRKGAVGLPEVAARYEFYLKRAPEELYDTQADPYCQKNLINAPSYQGQVHELRGRLLDWMRQTSDPALPALEARTAAAATTFLHEESKKAQTLRIGGGE